MHVLIYMSKFAETAANSQLSQLGGKSSVHIRKRSHEDGQNIDVRELWKGRTMDDRDNVKGI